MVLHGPFTNMNKLKLKKNDILHAFTNLTRNHPPIIQDVMENSIESNSPHCCICPDCSTNFNQSSSLSHIVFHQDNKVETCCSCCNRKNNKTVLVSSSHSGICLKSNSANKVLTSTKQNWTRNKKMVQVAAAVLTLLILTFCLLFQPGASPQKNKDNSWLRDTQKTNYIEDSLLVKVSSLPSVASRFGLLKRTNPEILPVTDIQQDDLFVSVKTSHQFHETRLDLILKTWFQLARDQTWFFTDQHDAEYEEKTSK